jgi:hypothetical protein
MIQEIGYEIIEQIKAYLSTVAGREVKGFGIGYKNIDGSVVLGCGEPKFIGIADNIGPFFYIRTLGNTANRRTTQAEAVGACSGNIITQQLRIVFIWDKCECSDIILSLSKALKFLNLNKPYTNGQLLPTINVKTLITSMPDIFFEETGKPKSEFLSRSISICAIDFEVTFRVKNAVCKTEKLC